VLTHWKEREPVYKARERRIRQQFGGELPAYAVATAGAPVDVAPKESKRRRDRVTQPMDPTQGVSQTEFDDMVRDLGLEEEKQPQPAAARASGRPAGGRRARSRGNGAPPGQNPPQQQQPPQQGGDGGDGTQKPKKPRNRRHGRPR
jgi:SecD/SecF fusion protein